MKKDDINLLREVQKNAETAIKSIDTISNKIYDGNMAMHMAKGTVKYSELKNRALNQLLEGKAQAYGQGHMQDLMLAGGIHSKTFLDISTGHIAEIMIQGSNKGITGVCKAINHNGQAGAQAIELAKEFIAFEEANIAELKKYL